MPEDKELIRRALLGDPEAQKRCTEKEIVLPCPFCGNEYPAITSVQGYGIEIKCQHCNITFCRVSYSYGRAKELCRSVTLGAWNARSAPPVGRCEDCKWSRQPTEQDYIEIGRDVLSYKDSCVCNFLEPADARRKNDFCSYLEPREE